MRTRLALSGAIILGAIASLSGTAVGATSKATPTIICPVGASSLETLAARETQRYMYLRTGNLLPIVSGTKAELDGDAVVIGQKSRDLFVGMSDDANLSTSVRALGPEEYTLRTIQHKNSRVVLIIGGGPVGTLYGAYRFAERLGVRFFLHGDEIPDARIPLELPMLDEIGKPLFELRGIQPFHDFPEGPDWWNLDDYKAIISQLPKLRMNFIGLHTYPEGGPNAEPTVWIGLREDIGKGTEVKYSYPSSYQNTSRGNWGYAPKKTGDFIFGAAQLFSRDAYGADVMNDLCPQPESPAASNQMFQRAGDLLRGAFEHAHRLGVKTCVGTETPLRVPKRVQEKLRTMGKDPAASSTIQALYEGTFTRAAQAYPLDFYWFWTPENWTWQGVSEAVVKGTINDMQAAIAAAKSVNSPLHLATCGWVLGPQSDRALFDNVLPKDMPLSCINRQVGKEPVDPGFERVTGRPKWAIPWLEDDPSLSVPQLWAGRMRMDAADALRYGCTGLMGIHWRTRVLAPNVLALAWAAWDQRAWKMERREASGPVGGQVAAFPNNHISDTQDEPLYQTVRYDMAAYRLTVPNGTYTVTLKFCEPHYTATGKRAFDVKIQGKKVIDNLDIFAKVGQNKALDYTFNAIGVDDGVLNIEFPRRIEYPCIAAIMAQSKEFGLKINCGGPAYKDYIADPPAAARNMPTDDFYRDWALSQFGPEAAEAIARGFESIDGNFACPATWTNGPGGLKADPQPWTTVQKQYAFVDELAALRSKIRGAGNLARFDYWLNTFRYTKVVGHVNCVWAEYNKAMAKIKAEKDVGARKRLAGETALPLRKELVRLVGETYSYLLATVSNPGELGTVANWEQHIVPGLLTKPGQELAQMLGEELPDDAQPPKSYGGPLRVIVPTVCTSAVRGEVLRLEVLILASTAIRDASLYWRPMGTGEFNKVPLTHVARGVYSVSFPSDGVHDSALEYFVRAVADGDDAVVFPSTAPAINQTIVVMPEGI